MIDSENVIYKLAAALLIIIGLVAIVSAWDLLLLAHVYSKTVLALELGGVVVCLAGYFLWKRTGMAKKELKEQEEMEYNKKA
jgi:uncharacterized membrane protein YfcA